MYLLAAAFIIVASGCAQIANPRGWAAPTVADDVLYATVEKGKMAALDPEDFRVKWEFPPRDNREDLDLEAIYGAPVVSADTIYFGAYDGNVYALNAEDGSERWRFETGGPIVSAVSADVRGAEGQESRLETLFVGSDDGKLYALDPANGSVKWSFDTGDSVWASPLVAGDVVYVPSVSGRLFALDITNGEERWSFKARAGLLTDPVLADKNTLLAGGIDQTLYALEAGTGRRIWTFDGDNWFWGRPHVVLEDAPAPGGVAYVPNLDGSVYAIDLQTGERIWSFGTEQSVRSSPVLAGGVLVAVNRKGEVYGLDPAQGQLKWGPTLLEKTVLSDPLPLDDQVLIVAEGGDLFRVDSQTGASSRIRVQR